MVNDNDPEAVVGAWLMSGRRFPERLGAAANERFAKLGRPAPHVDRLLAVYGNASHRDSPTS